MQGSEKLARVALVAVAMVLGLGEAPPALAAGPAHPAETTPTQRIDQEPIIAMPKKPPAAKPKPRLPSRPRPQPPTVIANAPTTHQLADLYVRVGRTLKEVAKADPNATIDLWPRFRWINLMDAFKTPTKRVEAAKVLERILADAQKLKA